MLAESGRSHNTSKAFSRERQIADKGGEGGER